MLESKKSKYHFISGLPRSGSTLLCSILNQNPKFNASLSGPLARFSRAIIEESSSQGGYQYQCPEEKREAIIKNIFEAYYPEDKVHFDTNRGWTLLLPLIDKLYPESKVILCVRDIAWILDSFEKLFQSNPLTVTSMFQGNEATNVYTRAETLMNPGRTLGFAYNALKQAIASDFEGKIKIVEYDTLAKYPEETIKSIYKFIGEDYFEDHNYNDIKTPEVAEDFDADVQLNGLHKLREKVQFVPRKTILPPDLFNAYKGAEVWRGFKR